MSAALPAVLAVDGGNSKAQVALVGLTGDLLSCIRGPSISHQAVGLAPGMATLRSIVDRALGVAGSDAIAGVPGGSAGHVAQLGVYCLAGADYPSDVRLLTTAIEQLQLTPASIVRNDTFAALRAGTHRPWGVALICGQGINGAGIAPDGRSARFDGLGHISGDWGGGGGIGAAALGHAVRARDGRGPRTTLEQLVPAHFGVSSAGALTRALYEERISERRLSELSPVVFRAAEAGDGVARSILDRQVAELVAMAGALIRRLKLTRLDPDVVLAGGVFRATDPVFYAGIEAGIRAVAPEARTVRLTAPPVLGAALVGLDRIHGGATPPEVDARIRTALEGRHDG
ncbi:MAG TPA: BadF/BadG/BcrA/BcrD ATPase family protein [Candidatus Limnocylindria bacterium]|nr:BadF/BadG/BcrA/BcrD ATPase family protein [Candidatus Limnocylindria bacterium]